MKAECTWGDGPDVVLSLEGTPLTLLEVPTNTHCSMGMVRRGCCDLTIVEARDLASQLLCAAAQAERLEGFYLKDSQSKATPEDHELIRKLKEP